ncbi:MAG: alanine--tRNA ligase, partial [Tissierellia bacterium]|nr:alanine--tRNA ligase [Tissierellia bacterium]
EDKFQETIDQGIHILENYIEEMENSGKNSLNGQKAFKLYDTYGFPLDLTKEILEEKGFTVDEIEFNQYMEEQRERARKARTADSGWKNEDSIIDFSEYNSNFKGYELLNLETEVLGLFIENKSVDNISEGHEGIIIIKETPFYAESGGQVGDTGYIKNENFLGEVLDTKYAGNTIIHFVKIKEGNVSLGDRVSTLVDGKRRKSIMRNHSATHLLHQALKEVLGEHVNQAGSIVLPNRLRFDFTHFEAVKEEELREIEKIVNEKILADLDIKTLETTLEESKKMGVIGLFDDKYEEEVRVVQMGDFSMELCGGTHVDNTGNIALFKIISESSIASGVRRIEAITGEEVYRYLNEIEEDLNNLGNTLKTNREGLIDKAGDLMEELKEKERELEALKSKMALSIVDEIINDKKDIDGIDLVVYKVENMDMNSLRNLGDEIKSKLGTGVIVLSSVHNGKISFVSMVTKDLTDKGLHAGNLIRDIAKITGGGGGGRPDMAQAGGKDLDKIDEAMNMVENIVRKQLN